MTPAEQGDCSIDGRFEEILDAVREGITVQAPDGRLLWANLEGARMMGFDSAEELLAASLPEVMTRFELVDTTLAPLDPSTLPGRRALAGEDGGEALVGWRYRDDGDYRWSVVRAQPVLGPDGQVRFAVNLFRDVSERQRARAALLRSEERFAFLASATRALLGAARDLGAVIARLAELSSPMLGEWCAVWELPPDGSPGHLASRVAAGGRGPYELAELTSLADELRSSSSWRAALGRGDPVRGGAPAQGGSPIDDDLSARLDVLGAQAGLVVPIRAGDDVLGAILLASEVADRYGSSEVALVEELSRRAGVAIENARLYAERSRAAEALARALVPSHLPVIPGVDVAAFYRPATSGVGGDFYDVVPLTDGRWLLVVGDVCGKGPEAASLTAMTRYTLRALAPSYPSSPAELLRATNAQLFPQFPDERFCTVVCATLTPVPDGAELLVAVAGHPRPLVVAPGGEVRPCCRGGTVLGLFDDVDVDDEKVVLDPGDAFVLLTDGCVGEGIQPAERLGHVLAERAGLGAAALADAVVRASADADPTHPDDVAILVAAVPTAARPPFPEGALPE